MSTGQRIYHIIPTGFLIFSGVCLYRIACRIPFTISYRNLRIAFIWSSINFDCNHVDQSQPPIPQNTTTTTTTLPCQYYRLLLTLTTHTHYSLLTTHCALLPSHYHYECYPLLVLLLLLTTITLPTYLLTYPTPTTTWITASPVHGGWRG